MSSALRERLAAAGARFELRAGDAVAADFGDWRAEYDALRAGAGLIDQSHRGKLRVTGRDRAEFLHGMVTNEIEALKPGQGVYAVFVSVKGKMLADARIYRLPDAFLLDLEPERVAPLSAHLDKYIIASDVTLADVTRERCLISVYGPASAAALERALGLQPPPPKECDWVDLRMDAIDLLAARNDLIGDPGYDLIGPAAAAPALWDRLATAGAAVGLRPVGWTALETARMEAGVPRYGVDMDETNFPMESMPEQRAVSFTKGCYIGQEVIARASTMGHMNRFLRGLEVEGAAVPQRGDVIEGDGQRLGVVTGACFSPRLDRTLALGYVRSEWADPGKRVAVVTGAGPVAAAVRMLPIAPPGR
jgi:folate-binding protein YgfZ